MVSPKEYSNFQISAIFWTTLTTTDLGASLEVGDRESEHLLPTELFIKSFQFIWDEGPFRIGTTWRKAEK